MPKKRILVFGLGNNFGGIETFYISYYRKIFDIFDIDFAYTTPTIVFEDEIKKHSNLYKLPDPKRNLLGYKKKLEEILKNNKYDIVHINMLSNANILPIMIAKKCKITKIILHSHNSGTPKGIFRKILHMINKKIISNKSYYTYLACSNLAGKWLFGKKTKYLILNNALDISKYEYNENKRKLIRKKYNIQNDEILIGHVGRFSEQKNHDFIIEVFNSLLKINNKYKLMLIGTGELEKIIREKVKQYGLEQNVIFTGTIKNTCDYYNSFDLFILPSLFEGLPIVGVEAQINGLPCLFSSKITSELCFQNNVKFLQISNYQKWVDNILNNDNRVNNLQNIRDNGYDIVVESKKLIKLYND